MKTQIQGVIIYIVLNSDRASSMELTFMYESKLGIQNQFNTLADVFKSQWTEDSRLDFSSLLPQVKEEHRESPEGRGLRNNVLPHIIGRSLVPVRGQLAVTPPGTPPAASRQRVVPRFRYAQTGHHPLSLQSVLPVLSFFPIHVSFLISSEEPFLYT